MISKTKLIPRVESITDKGGKGVLVGHDLFFTIIDGCVPFVQTLFFYVTFILDLLFYFSNCYLDK